MKARWPAALVLLFPLILGSCASQKAAIPYFRGEGKPALIKSATGKKDSSDLALMLRRRDSFVFFVTDPSCSSCAQFETMLKSYLPAHPVLLYKIGLGIYGQLETDLRKKAKLPSVFATPTLFFIDRGEMKGSVSYTDDPSVFKNSDRFEKTLNSYGTMTGLTYLLPSTEEEQDTVYYPSSDETLLLPGQNLKVIFYETVSSRGLSFLISSPYSNGYAAKDVTGLVVGDDDVSLSPARQSVLFTEYSIPTDLSLPVLIEIEGGSVQKVSAL